MHVSDLSGEGHSMAIRQPITTKPMYLYLEDGIPTRATGFFNHNALYEVNIPQSGGHARAPSLNGPTNRAFLARFGHRLGNMHRFLSPRWDYGASYPRQ